MNIQGLHNLCVVYVERGKLRQALECLHRAHKLAPEESYILKHLNIVKQRILDLSQAATMHKQKNAQINGNVGSKEFEERDGNEESDNDELEQAYAQIHNENNETSTTTDENLESSMTRANNLPNQKHPDDSTTNSINPNGMSRGPTEIKNDANNAETTNNKQVDRTRQPAPNQWTETNKFRHERRTTTPVFGHDLDEPSSGTS